MTDRSPVIPLVALWCLLALATSAHAECAWVLWSNQGTIISVKPRADGLVDVEWQYSQAWAPTQAFSEQGDCDQARKWYFDKQTPAPPHVGKKVTDYRCLPDTVDPRGPKGGK